MTTTAVEDPDRQPSIFCQATDGSALAWLQNHQHVCRKFLEHTGSHRCESCGTRWIGART